ncbi:hypothetical protein NHJ6243_007819 [Beauveria neobassiana]
MCATTFSGANILAVAPIKSSVQVLSAPVRYWQHHERLASFLGKLLEIPGDRFSAPRLQENFATLYRFVQFSSCRTAQSMAPSRDQHTKGTEHEQAGGVRWRLQDGITFETCYEFHQYADPSQVESPGQILFLTGYLTRTIREDTPNVLAEKHHRIQAGAKVPVGTTVIRNISVLDEMTLQLSNTSSYATSLPRSIEAGQFSESLLPIVVYKPMMGLNAHLLAKHCAVPSLHFGYGRFLRQSLASGHPFIALTKVVTLVASSEKHFLNMMELKLERAVLNSGGKPYGGSRARSQRSATRATATSGLRRTRRTDRARREVEQDFEYLHEHAETLYRRCQEEMAVLMNSLAILESEKAIAQAGQMARLTFLAFIFVPMAFVSSFFSMNVPELQSVPLWAWFVASTVILTQASNVGRRCGARGTFCPESPLFIAQALWTSPWLLLSPALRSPPTTPSGSADRPPVLWTPEGTGFTFLQRPRQL